VVVAIDGDAVGREQRCQELDDVLKKAGQQALDSGEKIAVCVPTRTIETWEIWLCDRSRELVDEVTDYKGRVTSEHAKQAAAAWFGPSTPGGRAPGAREGTVSRPCTGGARANRAAQRGLRSGSLQRSSGARDGRKWSSASVMKSTFSHS
jgi:hypothetical protein